MLNKKIGRKIRIAERFGFLATCPKRKVGVYIEDKYGKSVSSGYNGAPSGFQHCDVAGCQEIDGHCTNAVHAEINGILNGDIERMRDGTMFLFGAFPCYRCAQAIVTVKIKRLYIDFNPDPHMSFHGLTKDQQRGLDILNKGGVILTNESK